MNTNFPRVQKKKRTIDQTALLFAIIYYRSQQTRARKYQNNNSTC